MLLVPAGHDQTPGVTVVSTQHTNDFEQFDPQEIRRTRSVDPAVRMEVLSVNAGT